ncbi:hypothetical protein AciPR4_3105 [Terriglobus saanensis SP1PR4]|uniref:Terminase small subunit n=2 Tax=Terriglobus saanensis TaxID=870903 RepID=E8V6R1_TERSS|nr:hypothetical protein AciPR4_3105 [Terriglobus saanensis SP1PR4]
MLGKSERMIRNYIKDNGLPFVGDGRERRFIWAKVLEWYVAYRINLDGNRGNGLGASSLAPQIPTSETFDEAALRKLRAEADLVELKLASARGEVAAIADVERVLAASSISIQTQLLAVPSRLATQMLGLEDHGRAIAILEAEMRQVLTNLSTIDAVREATGLADREADLS